MDRFDRMTDEQWAEHIRSLEQDWRPVRVHSSADIPKWVVCRFGHPTEATFYAPGSFHSESEAREAADEMNQAPVDHCAACGQSVLMSPDDPPQTLLCDVCLASLERRREVRRANAALNQGGLF